MNAYRLIAALIPASIKKELRIRLFPPVQTKNNLLEEKIFYLENQISALRRIYLKSLNNSMAPTDSEPDIDSMKFYEAFETKFRGSSVYIKDRFRGHLKLLDTSKNNKNLIIGLDLACGRGEWLALLKEKGIRAMGVDLNPFFIEGCNKQGLDVVCDDVFSFLQSQSLVDYDFISTFHFIEHLEFEKIIKLLKLAYSKLKPGGFFIIETPNCANLIVAAITFRIDPTHVTPLHPDFCKFLFEYVGFTNVEIIGLSDSKDKISSNEKQVGVEIADLLWGSKDFVCIGYKE